MQIQLNIGGPLADAINNLAAALVSAKQADTIIEKASRPAKPKAEKAEKIQPAPVPADPPPSDERPVEAFDEQPATAPAEDSPAVLREQAKAALLAVVKSQGGNAAKDILSQFGASNITGVKDADLPAFIAALNEVAQ